METNEARKLHDEEKRKKNGTYHKYTDVSTFWTNEKKVYLFKKEWPNWQND